MRIEQNILDTYKLFRECEYNFDSTLEIIMNHFFNQYREADIIDDKIDN